MHKCNYFIPGVFGILIINNLIIGWAFHQKIKNIETRLNFLETDQRPEKITPQFKGFLA